MASLRQFKRRIDKIAKDLEIESNDNVKRLAAYIHQTVVLATPVDTGHARANWDLSLHAATTTVRQETDKSGQSTISRGNRVLTHRKTEETIHITNNVEYIPYLNNGSSAQAPAGFVEKAISAATNAFRVKQVIK